MKQHFLRLWAGFAHNCNQLVSIWDSGVKGRVTGDFKCCLPSGKTLTYTHTQHANAASAVLAILAEEMTSQWVGRGRKGRGGQVHSSESQGASTFGSSVIHWEPSEVTCWSWNHLTVLNTYYVLSILPDALLYAGGRWDGMLDKEAGWMPRPYIALKNDKLKLKKSLGWDFKEIHWKLAAPNETQFILQCNPLKSRLDTHVSVNIKTCKWIHFFSSFSFPLCFSCPPPL